MAQDLEVSLAKWRHRPEKKPDSAPWSLMFNAVQLLFRELIEAVREDGKQTQDLLNNEQPGSATWQLNVGGASATPAPNANKCRWNFEKPTAFTVQFGVDVLGYVPQATVVWYRGGNQIARTVDVTPGCSISGFGEEVSVTVADQTNAANIPGGVPLTYNVTAMISPGARATTAVPPIFTSLYGGSINAGATITAIGIPNGANGVMVFGVSGTGAAQLRVNLLGPGGSPNTLGSYEVDALSTGFIPLSAGVAQLTVKNEGSGTATAVSVIFSIDG